MGSGQPTVYRVIYYAPKIISHHNPHFPTVGFVYLKLVCLSAYFLHSVGRSNDNIDSKLFIPMYRTGKKCINRSKLTSAGNTGSMFFHNIEVTETRCLFRMARFNTRPEIHRSRASPATRQEIGIWAYLPRTVSRLPTQGYIYIFLGERKKKKTRQILINI